MRDDETRQPASPSADPTESTPRRGRPGAPAPVPASEIPGVRPAPPKPDDDLALPVQSDRLANAPPDLSPLARRNRQQPVSGLLVSLVAGVLVLGLGLLALGTADPDETVPLLETTDVVFWVVAGVVILLVAAGAQFAELSARVAATAVGQPRERTGIYSAWILAATATAAATLLMATWHNLWVVVLGAMLVVVGIFVALLSRDLIDDLTDSAGRAAALAHGAIIHLVAFVALATIYLNKLPEWISAGLIAVISGLLILETLQRAEISSGRRLAYAGLGAIVMGQCAIAINWWLTWNWTGGIALLVCFYLVTGILITYSQQSDLRPRDVAFYGGLGSLALTAIAILAL